MGAPDLRSSEPVTLAGACDCGAVQFRAELPQGLASARRCTCSICRMRGAVAVSGSIDGFRIIQGQDKLATYRFNTGIAEHHFCSACGIYTHHKRRSNPDQLGINVACLEGLSPFDFADVVVNDGELHPSDNGGRTRVAGVLKYERSGEP
jgi:hypothetical protein